MKRQIWSEFESIGSSLAKRPRSEEQNDDCTVCFGAIISFEVHSTSLILHKAHVTLQPDGRLTQLPNNELLGLVNADDLALLNLFRQDGIDMELCLVPDQSTTHKRRQAPKSTLWVTLSGPLDIADDLGKTLQDLDLYLQDPIHSQMRLPYHNPQLFGPKDAHNLENETSSDPSITVEMLSPSNLLPEFVSNEDLEETEGSSILKTSLKSHQRRGLTFMTKRERGWNMLPNNCDVWSKELDAHGNTVYINNITNETKYTAPPAFRGGLLADRMGLGKSLAVLALIAYDKDPSLESSVKETTLIVVPPALLQSWEDQMKLHYRDGTMKWKRHHGSQRIAGTEDIESHDIIICSYPTLAREWRQNAESSTLFQHKWHRVVLDEAHMIKNTASLTAKATFALRSERRWAVTATPIQNRLTELASLFQFLRLFPYCEKAAFDTHITNLWTIGQAEEALKRLKRLLGFVMLCRSSEAITLPPRTDRRVTLQLETTERQQYDRAKEQAIRRLDDAFFCENAKLGYINALSKINTLRLICNLSEINSKIVDRAERPNQECQDAFAHSNAWDLQTATAMLHEMPLLGLPYTCTNCKSSIEGLQAEKLQSVLLTQCLLLWCSGCDKEASSLEATVTYCTCPSPCPHVRLPFSSVINTESSPPPPFSLHNGKRQYPAKIKALISDLKSTDSDVKSIVFSFWKSSLDLIKMALTETEVDINCLQIDGTVPNKRRPDILNQFQTGRDYKVLLLSLSCGAVGLNLTAASRVYLMEPQWNPAIEEQALARVHRLGQTREVTTVRFVIDNTIEKFVLDLQEKKRDFSNILFSGKGGPGLEKVTQERLEELRSLLR
ncbi:SNF2 family N-terminal domain-containing protein [Podospora fimiseda]|uniref:SNF2 family N-terminal domain-containing protein n=1 Tax=Podospora fimiseda TaxID=252190 RepID=A0AAN6YP81_9PEZI|nr:SNF2 family N-terminal domain-containing protein [Podospora fimiseda]